MYTMYTICIYAHMYKHIIVLWVVTLDLHIPCYIYIYILYVNIHCIVLTFSVHIHDRISTDWDSSIAGTNGARTACRAGGVQCVERQLSATSSGGRGWSAEKVGVSVKNLRKNVGKNPGEFNFDADFYS